MNVPKISIVTPSFNQAEFLESTIQSVLSQNYPNLEYIIIDGGSSDHSLALIKKYEKYLHFWCSEPDGGQYDAIDKGFSHSTGEIMSWINSDDLYYPWTFKTVASIMSELPQVEWLTTLNLGEWDWHGFCSGFTSSPGYSKEAFLDGLYCPQNKNYSGFVIQQESTFWKRSLWEKSGGHLSTEFKLAGDFELWSRFFYCAELYNVKSPLGGFRRQINQRSRQIDLYAEESQKILLKMSKNLDYHSNFLKFLAHHMMIHRLPKKTRSKILSILSFCGYTANEVVRKNADSSEAYWDIEQYNF
ncbi:glycosyltransferase family 2 protein [Laspinema olomoucense]|uniref:Glycosyltransferase n=1 Tax=Laspinema olomoucense D3b TaxID=2953688 RepID=A0ABT2N3Y0_9CYAN|nr:MULTISPECIES: glycosyltransferase family 2 protein [unclassified Laspinema]MCT7977394.1 glycosyltransferase [Laspinema sp. D3b]MCT7986813.1 glycosyltransferase [Laspinema sp. D3a]